MNGQSHFQLRSCTSDTIELTKSTFIITLHFTHNSLHSISSRQFPFNKFTNSSLPNGIKPRKSVFSFGKIDSQKYKQLQTRENGDRCPCSLCSAMPYRSCRCYSSIVSLCSNIVDMSSTELCRSVCPWVHPRKPHGSAKSEGDHWKGDLSFWHSNSL